MKTLAAVFACVALALWVAAPTTTEAATVDCSSVLLSLADCLTYVSEGSTLDKPEASCCNGLKTVLKASPECLCVGFRSSAQFGVKLNLTKAFALPSACHLSAPPTDCANDAPAPQVAPFAHAPDSASTPAPEANVPVPSSDSTSVVTPASSPPGKSAAAFISTMSLVTTAFGLIGACLVGI